jgi:hydroxysqualene dehydroxylase
MHVIVIGGGWAGLSAAVELARNGHVPTVLEAARQPGGRARSVRFGNHHVDNGQHILLGAYRHVLSMLHTLGVAEHTVFKRLPLTLALKNRSGPDIRLTSLHLPAPLHLAVALARMTGLPVARRLETLRLLARARRGRFKVEPDVTLGEYLARCRQGGAVIRALWEPLCLAALNTPVALASTQLFLHVLRDAFFGNRRDSDLLLPATDLNACLPRPAIDYIERHGGSVRLAARAQAIRVTEGCASGVVVQDEELLADHVIVATSPDVCANLLADHAPLHTTVEGLAQLGASPICTVYLQYPDSAALDLEFVGLLDGIVQWLFDHGRFTGRRGLMAAVISGPGPHLRLNNEALTSLVIDDIAHHFPEWPRPLATRLVRERRATFAAVPDVDRYRPGCATVIPGLWLAGDYTDTGYPGTLEGAVKSGIICARRLLAGPHSSIQEIAAS